MKKIAVIHFLWIISISLQINGQVVTGIVYELDEQSNKLPIEFVNVYWSGTNQGTITNDKGQFSINKNENNDKNLVFSFVGYSNDTIEVTDDTKELNIVLTTTQELKEVTISKDLGGSYISKLQPVKTEVITISGLQKLPCCNLSESFENSATIDAGYSDALTGARYIKMLGLAGTYSQLLFENIPFLRGLESSFGLNYVPGPWMESIQISKGAASVINGYESTTGQINLEYHKPQNSDPLFINLFGNSSGRGEANILSAFRLNDKWSSMIMGHVSAMQTKIDRNKDTFMDLPMMSQVNIFNRWMYNPEGNLSAQFGVNILEENRKGGQINYDFSKDNGNNSAYGIDINSRKLYSYGKLGFVFPGKPYNSIGFINSMTIYSINGLMGLNSYAGEQMNYYSNLISRSIIGSTNHTLNTGISFMYDKYEEILNNEVFKQHEIVPGIFGQYNYTLPDKFNGILGLRADWNSQYGFIITPRLHIRYNIDPNTILRASAGKGYHSAHILSENIGVMTSSRIFHIATESDMESAWNYGMNLNKVFHFDNNREINFSLDIYRTDFMNQIIVDLDKDISAVYFYNLDGRSYSNSMQAQIKVSPVERFEIVAAYRFNDVKSTINKKLSEIPLMSKYKGLLTLSYAKWFNKWSFDLTTQLNGQSRLPDTHMNPPEYRKSDYSPRYIILHAQVTKRFRNFDIYAGGENLTDFRQKDPVIAPDDPFGEYFDASLVWGPLMGRTFYAGIRYTLK